MYNSSKLEALADSERQPGRPETAVFHNVEKMWKTFRDGERGRFFGTRT